MRQLKRIIIYSIGIFLFAMGVAFAIKSDLGVSPVSSLPYVVSLLSGFSVGTMTFLLYVVFIIVQWIILRQEFKKIDLLQIIFAFVFGFCVDLSRVLIKNLGNELVIIQVAYLIIGTVIIGFGIFLILKSGLIVSPTDGLVKAIAKKADIEFAKVKISVDLGTAVSSAIISLTFLGQLKGVGLGTIFSAFGVGMTINFFERTMGHHFELENIKEV